MHETSLAQFFLNRLPATALANDVKGSTHRISEIRASIEIKDMPGLFLVTRAMAIALCDAVINGELPAQALETIGFALATSDCFSGQRKTVSRARRSIIGPPRRLIMR